MARIEDFEKRYVNMVVFNEGDKILVTKENIKDLRKILKNTNFRWRSGDHITECTSFEIDKVIILDDKIVVTQENIEFLRQYLKTTNFRWRSGHHVTDSNASIRNDTEPAFGINRVLIFESDGVWTNTFDQIDKDSLSDAVNYFFVDY